MSIYIVKLACTMVNKRAPGDTFFQKSYKLSIHFFFRILLHNCLRTRYFVSLKKIFGLMNDRNMQRFFKP